MAGPFELALRAFAEKAKGNADAAVRAVVLEIASRLIVRSPVDTGRFRGNWFYSLDRLDGRAIGGTAEGAAAIYQGGAAAAYSTTVNNIAELPITAGGHVHYLQNNLPYAMRLEFGFSGTDSLGRSYSQAPRAFVRLTLAEFKQIADGAARGVAK